MRVFTRAAIAATFVALCAIALSPIAPAAVTPGSVPATPSPQPAQAAMPTIGFGYGMGSTGWLPFIRCDKSVAISDSASGFTELVAAVAGKAVYVCGLSFQSAGTVNVKFAQGAKTTTPCDTSETDLTGAYPEVANAGISLPNERIPYFTAAAGDELCVNLSAAIGVYGVLSYAQM